MPLTKSKPFNIAPRRDATKTVSIPFEDNTIEIEYRPSARTPAVVMQLQTLEGAAQFRYTIDLLALMIVDWNLYDGNHKLPVSVETLMQLEQPMVNAISTGVSDDLVPKVGTSEPSPVS